MKTSGLTGRKSQVLYRLLAEEINSGRYAPGDVFHSIRDICRMYSVSLTTAVKCVERLVEEGAVESRQGSGTYVRVVNAVTRTESGMLHVDYVMPEDIERRAGPEYLTDHLKLVSKPPDGMRPSLRMVMFPNLSRPREVEEWLNGLLAHGAQALVFRWMPRVAQEIAAERRLPVCVYGRVYEGIRLPFADATGFGERAADYLIEQGCHRIALLMRAEWRPGDNEMLNVLLKCLGRRLACVETCPPIDADVDAAVARIRAMDPPVDGLILRQHPGTWLQENLTELAGINGTIPVVSEYKFHPLVTHVAASRSTFDQLAELVRALLKGNPPEPRGYLLPVDVLPPTVSQRGTGSKKPASRP